MKRYYVPPGRKFKIYKHGEKIGTRVPVILILEGITQKQASYEEEDVDTSIKPLSEADNDTKKEWQEIIDRSFYFKLPNVEVYSMDNRKEHATIIEYDRRDVFELDLDQTPKGTI